MIILKSIRQVIRIFKINKEKKDEFWCLTFHLYGKGSSYAMPRRALNQFLKLINFIKLQSFQVQGI